MGNHIPFEPTHQYPRRHVRLGPDILYPLPARYRTSTGSRAQERVVELTAGPTDKAVFVAAIRVS